jgi:hypothetical protein
MFLSIAAALVLASGPVRAQIVIVTHPSVTAADVPLVRLERLYWGDTNQLESGQTATLGELEPIMADFYRKLLRKTAKEVAMRWLKVIFSGNARKPPVQFATAVDLKRFVAQTPGAVAFLASADVDASVKVLRVDGLAPGDPRYPLR